MAGVGKMREMTAESTSLLKPSSGGRGLTGIVDAMLFIAILGFSAVALLAVALAAPLAIAASAVAGALSALTARTAKRGGWRAASA
jgi:hypothetical protein